MSRFAPSTYPVFSEDLGEKIPDILHITPNMFLGEKHTQHFMFYPKSNVNVTHPFNYKTY